MAINLQKGQSINLDKKEHDLSRMLMGLGWDVAKPKGLLGGLLGGNTTGFDLDSYALLLSEHGKLQKGSEDVIYFSHLSNSDGTVVHSGDNLTGAGTGDDEQIIVKLNSLPEHYHKIILGVNIYQGKERKQHFGLVSNAFVRVVDSTGKEIARYSLSGNAAYQDKVNMLMGEVYKQNGEWKFKALGEPLSADLQGVIRTYL